MHFFTTWQDAAITLGQIIFILALIPSILSKDKPNSRTSFINVIVLISYVYIFWTLGLIYTTITMAFTGVMWFVLYVQKVRIRKVFVQKNEDTRNVVLPKEKIVS